MTRLSPLLGASSLCAVVHCRRTSHVFTVPNRDDERFSRWRSKTRVLFLILLQPSRTWENNARVIRHRLSNRPLLPFFSREYNLTSRSPSRISVSQIRLQAFDLFAFVRFFRRKEVVSALTLVKEWNERFFSCVRVRFERARIFLTTRYK